MEVMPRPISPGRQERTMVPRLSPLRYRDSNSPPPPYRMAPPTDFVGTSSPPAFVGTQSGAPPNRTPSPTSFRSHPHPALPRPISPYSTRDALATSPATCHLRTSWDHGTHSLPELQPSGPAGPGGPLTASPHSGSGSFLGGANSVGSPFASNSYDPRVNDLQDQNRHLSAQLAAFERQVTEVLQQVRVPSGSPKVGSPMGLEDRSPPHPMNLPGSRQDLPITQEPVNPPQYQTITSPSQPQPSQMSNFESQPDSVLMKRIEDLERQVNQINETSPSVTPRPPTPPITKSRRYVLALSPKVASASRERTLPKKRARAILQNPTTTFCLPPVNLDLGNLAKQDDGPESSRTVTSVGTNETGDTELSTISTPRARKRVVFQESGVTHMAPIELGAKERREEADAALANGMVDKYDELIQQARDLERLEEELESKAREESRLKNELKRYQKMMKEATAKPKRARRATCAPMAVALPPVVLGQKDAIDSLSNDLIDQTDELVQRGKRIDDLEDELRVEKRAKNLSQRELVTMRVELGKLKAQLAQAQQERGSATEEEVAALRERLEEKRNSNYAFMTEMNDLRTQLGQKDEQIGSLQNQVKDLQQTCQSLLDKQGHPEDFEELRRQVIELSEQLEKTQERAEVEVKKWQEELIAKSAAYDELMDEAEEWRKSRS